MAIVIRHRNIIRRLLQIERLEPDRALPVAHQAVPDGVGHRSQRKRQADRGAAGADDDLVAGIQRFPDGGAVSFGDLTRVIQQCAVQIKKDCFCFHLVTPVPILRYD